MSKTNNHPWSSDPVAQTAVRAAEDAAAATRVPPPDHRDLPQAVHDLRRRVEGLETLADAWRRQCEADADAENREAAVVSREGVTFTENGVFREAKTPSGAVNHAADVSCGEADRLRKGPLEMPSKAWMKRMCEREGDSDCTTGRPVPPADGLRTERVTLEVTHDGDLGPLNGWPFRSVLNLGKGESIRVVEEATIGSGDVFADVGCGTTGDEIIRLTAKRDAALRERDAAREEAERATTLAKGLEEERAYFKRERDAAREECERLRAEKAADWKAACESALAASIKVCNLKARVRELESAAAAPAAKAGGVSNPEPISGAGKSGETGNQEPVLYGVLWEGRPRVESWDVRDTEEQAVRLAGTDGTVVPLYAAPVAESATTPQPPRGWLTEEERAWITETLDQCRKNIEARLDEGNEEGAELVSKTCARLRSLLARSTPPRVKVPVIVTGFTHREHAEGWVKAIREAGGEVE